ncbi:hypothetical protein HKD37_03G006999 [Glycine soja]|nr:hypothetical protein GmHk_03G007008 [Glycine max]
MLLSYFSARPPILELFKSQKALSNLNSSIAPPTPSFKSQIEVAEKPSVVEARTLSLTSSHQGYSKIFATLGIVCKCCDGVEGGACTSTWTESCSNLQCSPWKSHS